MDVVVGEKKEAFTCIQYAEFQIVRRDLFMCPTFYMYKCFFIFPYSKSKLLVNEIQ